MILWGRGEVVIMILSKRIVVGSIPAAPAKKIEQQKSARSGGFLFERY